MGRYRALLVAAGAFALALPAAAAPTQVTLAVVGAHPVGQEFHQGTFTAPAPLCPAGSWVGNGSGTRTFTCSDGTGTFTVSFDGNLEHTQGSTGPWAIQAGTGAYTALRGVGTAHIDSSSTDSSGAVNFTETWTGTADFDATAPTGSITAVKLTRPAKPSRPWKVRVSFSAADNVAGNAVSYQATATAGSVFVQRRGTVATGAGSFSFSFRRPAAVHVLRLEIDLADPLGNTSAITKRVKLRS